MNERTKKEIKKFLFVSKTGKKKKKKQVKQNNFQEIQKNTDEYQSICEFYEASQVEKEYQPQTIFRIDSDESSKEDDKRLVWTFHGSKPEYVANIITEGLKESKEGCCGRNGIYLSLVSSLATEYGAFKTTEGVPCSFVFIVVLKKSHVTMPNKTVDRNCKFDSREREHEVEHFKGNINLQVEKFGRVKPELLKKQIAKFEVKKTSCWTFSKFLASPEAVKLKYLICAVKKP